MGFLVFYTYVHLTVLLCGMLDIVSLPRMHSSSMGGTYHLLVRHTSY